MTVWYWRSRYCDPLERLCLSVDTAELARQR